MKRAFGALPLLLASCLGVARQGVDREIQQAAEASAAARARATELLKEGDLDEAERVLLEAFPAATRTPAQTLFLADLLFRDSPKLSYALHRSAVEKLPDHPTAHLEGAMEQHRAGKYAGAAASYAKYNAAVPDHAPPWGLAADCLVRLGRLKEAVAAWAASEAAGKGTLEQFERMVCEIYSPEPPSRRRSEYRAAMLKGSLDAGVKLISLDCNYPQDWWNVRTAKVYLEKDFAAFRTCGFPPGRRVDAVECAAECALANDAAGLRAALTKHRFVLDPDRTLPSDPFLAAFMIDRAVALKAVAQDERKPLTDKVVASARRAKDRDLWNAALYLHGDPIPAGLEKEAQTGDPTFAVGYLHAVGARDPDDPVLREALKAHPEHMDLMRGLIAQAKSEKRLTAELLAQGIRAEYRRFSATGIVPRPRAATLRLYFAELAALLK